MYSHRIALVMAAVAALTFGAATATAQDDDIPPMLIGDLYKTGLGVAEDLANTISETPAPESNWRVRSCKMTGHNKGYCDATWKSRTAKCKGRIVIWEDPSGEFDILYYTRNMRCRARA
jgi:hypothetical protein